MSRLLLVVLAALLMWVPLEPSARQVVKHHAAKAQARAQPAPQAANPNCALGGTPPAGTQCGISDLTLRPGGALQDTDTMRICPNASGCFGTSPTYQDAQAPLGSLWTPYIRSKLSPTAPVTYNSSTGAIGCTPFGASNLTNGCVPTASGAPAGSYLSSTGGWTVPPTASGSGVNAGTINQVTYYAATGSVVSGSPNVTLVSGGGLTVNRNTALPPPISQAGALATALQIVGANNEAPFLLFDGFGPVGTTGGNTIGAVAFRAARGTAAAPTQIQNLDVLGNISWRGYEGTTPAYSGAAVARLGASALENFTATGQGSQVFISTNPVGQTGGGTTQATFGPGVQIGTPTAPTGAAMAAGDLNVQGRIMQQGVPISGGAATTITLAPGLASTPGTYNTGTQTVTNSSTLSPQLFWEGHSANYTVLATDSGKLLEATAGGITFTLPAIGAAGSGSYAFSYSQNASPYTVATGSATTIYGCGPSGTGVTSITLVYDATFIPTANGWKCSGSIPPSTTPLSWGPGMNLATSPIPMIRRPVATNLAGFLCMAGVTVAGTPANIDLYYCPDGSVPPAGTGCLFLATGTTTAPAAAGTCHAGTGTGGGAGVLQPLVSGATGSGLIPAQNTVWAVGSGAGWTAGNVVSSSGMIQFATIP